jgi:hypothetical protein
MTHLSMWISEVKDSGTIENMLKESIRTDSNISSTRIALFFCIFSSVIIALIGIIMDRDLLGVGAIITALNMPIAGVKAYQSRQEHRAP